MSNYSNISGVEVRTYRDEDTGEEPSMVSTDARVDEMYVSGGYLYIGIEENGTFRSINIPILPDNQFSDFAESLNDVEL